MELDRVLEFNQLLLQLQSVERAVAVPGRDQPENDVEHSYNLAMMGWYLNEQKQLGLSTELLLQYALIHDLAEAYAGDTYIFDADHKQHQTKAIRENLAARLIGSEFPDFPALHELLERYEARGDEEARFIYALDKVMPVVVYFQEGGSMWRQDGITLKQMDDNKRAKVAAHPLVAQLWDDLYARLRSRPELFGSQK